MTKNVYPPPHKRLSILAGSNALFGQALAAALATKEFYRVDVLTHGVAAAASTQGEFHLVIAVVGHDSPATLTRRVRQLYGRNVNILLVLGTDIYFAMHHLSILGADGVISTQSPLGELLTAVQIMAVQNLKYISPRLLSSFVETALLNPFATLSRKELDVALSVMNGIRNVEIAAGLFISQKTVNTYKSRIYRKLAVSNGAQLLHLALLHGLLTR
jgi:DNA-binding NarL/FixJ family response regulator